MRTIIFQNIICASLLFSYCSSKKGIKQVEEITQYCDFIEIKSPFEMRILDYIPSGECGNRAFASNCIGITKEGDTIRVLSLCNTDTTFKINDMVIVIPRPKPNFEVAIAQHWINKNSHVYLSNIQKRKLKTIYGTISLKR